MCYIIDYEVFNMQHYLLQKNKIRYTIGSQTLKVLH